MADLTSIRDALGTQLFTEIGIRADAQARDQVSPPVIVILPGQPLITYGVTATGPDWPGAVNINLIILLILSDAAPSEKTQRALDAYLGIGSGETQSIAGAIQADPTLGGTVHFCEPVTASNYGRIDYAGQSYFGARVNVQVGSILAVALRYAQDRERPLSDPEVP
jgi:hypothetical protein